MVTFLTWFVTTALGSFWSFVGCCIIISMLLTFLFRVYNRTLRCITMRKHGYPPAHCDADGDFEPEPENE